MYVPFEYTDTAYKVCKMYLINCSVFQECILVDGDMAVPEKHVWASFMQKVFQAFLVGLKFEVLTQLL